MAGVAIHFTLGENGILRNAEISGEKYEEVNAKEQLTLELANIQTKKYKETGKKTTLEDVKNLINKNKYDVDIEEGSTSAQIEDMENEYTFIVDENLTIQDVEKVSNQDKNIIIETESINEEDYTTSTIKAKIIVTEELSSIKIAGNEIEVTLPTKEDDNFIYKVEKEVENNGSYRVKVETISGKTNSKIEIVKNLSENMEIKTLEDLIWFRDRVNIGATYEKRTVTLMNDIDLASICGEGKESFVPIGNGNQFRGDFNGNNHLIKNVYINESATYNGLFGNIDEAKIRNLTLDGGYVSKGVNTGGICALARNSTFYNCINNTEINGTTRTTAGIVADAGYVTIEQCANLKNISGTHSIGGIAGVIYESVVINSYNTGNIITRNSGGGYSQYIAGGIVGQISTHTGSSEIINCYNTGEVYGKTYTGGIAGWVYLGKNHIVTNCYSMGAISGGNKYAIAGQGSFVLDNNYWLEDCGVSSGSASKGNTNAEPKTEAELKALAEILGDAYTNDEKIKVIDEETGKEKEVWRNNGYPILKWQKNY